MLKLGQERPEPDCFDQTPGIENVRYKHPNKQDYACLKPKTYPLFFIKAHLGKWSLLTELVNACMLIAFAGVLLDVQSSMTKENR